jgi:ribosome-associated protein
LSFTKPRSIKGRAQLCARVAQSKMGRNIHVLDMQHIESAPAAFFVIVTVDSDTQLRAVCHEIESVVHQLGFGWPKQDGKGASNWVALDYFDIVVHVMIEEARDFYSIERLWGDATAYTITETGTLKARGVTKAGL